MSQVTCDMSRSAAVSLTTQIRPWRKMNDFGDLGRALEMVALLPEVALGR